MSSPTDADNPDQKESQDDWNVENTWKSTCDKDGRWTIVLKDLNTGELTTWSERIEQSMSRDEDRPIRRFMHRLDSMACLVLLERSPSWLREPLRFGLLPFLFGWLACVLGLLFVELYRTRWRTRNRGIVLE